MADPPWKLADVRVTVQGTRGKTSLAIILHGEVTSRGRSSFCKTTGASPLLCVGRRVTRMRREGPVRLYENLLEVGRSDYCVMENQGVSPYTMRVFNEVFVRPQIIAVTNVRLDHVEEMGRNRDRIARSMASTFSSSEVVFSGEGDPHLNDVLRREARKLIEVNSPDPDMPGSEIPALADEILRYLGLDGLDVGVYLRRMRAQLKWRGASGVTFFDASKVNDPDSASLLVRWLGGKPLIFIQLRRDRPGRTWAFLRMIREGRVDHSGVLVSGDWSEEFARRVGGISLPDSCGGAMRLLEEVRRRGRPLFITGNRRGAVVDCLLRRLGVRESIPTILGKIGEDGSVSLG